MRFASKNFGQVAPRSDERATTTCAEAVPELLVRMRLANRTPSLFPGAAHGS